MAELTRILSIDGAGIRGIIPGQVLVSLERKLQEQKNDESLRLADCFDLIAGTSTGGILTCVYLCPGPDPGSQGAKPRPRFSAQDAVDLYVERGPKIFKVSLWQKIRSLGGIRDEKYSADELEETLKDYFGDVKLSNLLGPCLITAYDIESRCAVFFTQHDAEEERKDFFVRDVARATSAAPTYFQVARVESMTHIPYPLIDGGVFASNPALCAFAEARNKLPGKPTASEMAILSLGTGCSKERYDYKRAKHWGSIGWVVPLIDIMLSGTSETVDRQLAQLFDSVGKPEQYLRVDSELRLASYELDDASQKNIDALCAEGARIAQEFDAKLDGFVELL